MSDPNVQWGNRTRRTRLWKSFVKFKACLETSDWNIDIALLLTISNFIWFGHLVFPSEQREKDTFKMLWIILTCFGVFVIPPGVAEELDGAATLLYIVEALASLTLLSGVYHVKRARLECWLVVNLCTCIHEAWWFSLYLLNKGMKLPISNGFGLGVAFVSYCCFNGLYMWRIFRLRREDPTFSASEHGCCCPLIHCFCFGVTALCVLVAFGSLLDFHLGTNLEHRNLYIAAVVLGILMFWNCCVLLVKQKSRHSAVNGIDFRFLTQLWSLAVTVVLIISGVCQFGWILKTARFDWELSELLLLRFVFLDLPASLSIFIAFQRMKWMAGLPDAGSIVDSAWIYTA